MRPQVLLKAGVELDIGTVGAKQIELDLVLAGAIQEMLVEGEALGRDGLWCGDAVGVLPTRGISLEEGSQGSAIVRRWHLPVALDGIPALAEALQVGVAVLGDQRGHALGVRQGQAEADRCAVVKDVQSVAIQANRLDEALDDVCQVVKGIGEFLARGRVRKSEAR